MNLRHATCLLAFLLFLSLAPRAASTLMSVDELKPGMEGIGRTVFQGDRIEEFKVHIIGVLRNVVAPSRDLILAKLEGGPLADTGVIAGMSGSPVYVDGRLIGAVSYSLGAFSKEPIAGITPIEEMTAAAALPAPRAQTIKAAALTLPITRESLAASLRETFAWMKPFAGSPYDVQHQGALDGTITPAMATMLRPIATPLAMGGFSSELIQPIAAAFQDQGGFVPVSAAQGGGAVPARTASAVPALRAGDALGVALIDGDLSLGATGTVTYVDGTKVYAFGHPFYNLGPTEFPMTRAYVHTVLPSLFTSTKIASTGEVIGTIQQDRATTVAGTLGPGPVLIPVTISLSSERGQKRAFKFGVVTDQMFTPLMTYMALLQTLGSYERQFGTASYTVKGSATLKKYGTITFEDLFTGDQPSINAAAYVVGPINLVMRNAFENVELESLNLEIAASEQALSATIERAWLDVARPKAGTTVPLKVQLRTYRGDAITRTVPIDIPANANGSLTVMVSDGTRLSQWESRELQQAAVSSSGVPQMLKVLNQARKNNRIYVRLLGTDPGAVVKGEVLPQLPPSVMGVLESDRNGGSFSPLRSALLGQWEISTDQAIIGSRTLTLTIDQD